MIEPISLSLGAVIAALVAKASDRAVDGTVDAGAGVLSRLVSKLRARFAGPGDEPAREALERVADVPDSARLQEDLAKRIDALAEADAGLREDLERFVEEAKSAKVQSPEIHQYVKGSQNVVTTNTTNSVIQVSYGTSPVSER